MHRSFMSEPHSDTQDFGWIRSLLWPVHRHELKKLIPMLLIFFFIGFNYNVLRTMKDTLVVTAKASGAEVIPFIKVYAMFPSAILATFLFTRLSNRFAREKVIYAMLGLFLTYFFLFAFFFYPNRDVLHPNETADMLQTILPAGCKGFIAMYRNWTFTIFYVIAELWSNIVLFVLVWGFTNQVTRINEAKRFYGLFGFGANSSGIVAGQISVFFCRKAFDPNLPFGTTSWEQSMTMLISLVIISGMISMVLFRWMYKKVLPDPKYYKPEDAIEDKKIKGKLSLRENFSYILSSKYMIYITLLVVSYNVVINLIEVVWKGQLRELYPNPSEYGLYINQVSTIVGICATLAAVFVSANAIRFFGWTVTAMITPLILLATSIVFFGLFFSKDHLSTFAMAVFGTTPLAMLVLVGSIQNILCRGAKYTVFDATKEMALVPLSSKNKLMGAAAIDGVCNRFGKSGGSFIHSNLLLIFASFSASAPYVAAILLLIVGVWMAAAFLLGKEFNALTSTPQSKPLRVEEDIALVEQGAV